MNTSTQSIMSNWKASFSLDEQIVGTWIDGKSLYQKTLTCTIPNGVNTSQDVTIDCTSLNILQCISISYCHNGSGISNGIGYFYPPPTTASLQFWYLYDNKQIWIRRKSSDSTSLGGGSTGFITIQYTKTTD